MITTKQAREIEKSYFDKLEHKEEIESEIELLSNEMRNCIRWIQDDKYTLSMRDFIKNEDHKFLIICLVPPSTFILVFMLLQFRANLIVSIICTIIVTWFVTVRIIKYTYHPSVEELLQRIASKMSQFNISQAKITYLKLELDSIKSEYDNLHKTYYETKNLLSSTLISLHESPWKSLRGIPFEQFLKQVFNTHGHTAELTKVSGDKGVDLIVNLRGKKMAVQAKGYENSVGLEAVQQVYSGKAFYDCDLCCVITNSTFTTSAIDLADKLGCKLVDQESMKEFIFNCNI